MTRTQVFQEVVQLMKGRFQKVDGKTITEEDRLEEDLVLDSLDKIDFWLEVEEKYMIDVPQTEVFAITTVKDVIDLVCKYMKA